MISTNDLQGKPGIGGGLAQREAGRENGIVNYIGVESIDLTLQQVIELGGRILQPVQPVPGYGKLAVCADTDSNVFGVFEEGNFK
jgi:predicted enzyme related to lactoylglutathione lyase